jgi:hypothetical protein
MGDAGSGQDCLLQAEGGICTRGTGSSVAQVADPDPAWISIIFWKPDPDPQLSDKLEVAKIAYSKQKEEPTRGMGPESRIRIRHGSALFSEAGSGSALEG